MSTFTEYFIDTLKNRYADFSGRATRSEYWYFALYNILISIAFYVMIIFGALTDSTLFLSLGGGSIMILSFGLIIPSLAVAVRRLHDIGKSGWHYLLGMIPLAGPIILLVFFCTDSEQGENNWGSNPKEMEFKEDII